MEYTFGEYLFEATSESIIECLTNISEDMVKDSCDYKIFLRGIEYYEDGLVEYFSHNKGNNSVDAIVIGSMEYGIVFYQKNGSVYSSCDCPYDGVCKHTIAALLYIVHEGIDHIGSFDLAGPSIEESLDFLKEYLNRLSKKDLIALVMKFAPQNFITEIHNQQVKTKDAKKIFIEVEKKIGNFFRDDRLLYDPKKMENALMQQIEVLKGLEKSLSDEIGKLIILIIRSIEDAFNEGYLYIDDYYGDDFFESEAFCEYVIAYVRQLPADSKSAYLLKLNQALDEMSYDTFYSIQNSYHRFFSDEELPDLKLFVTGEKKLSETLFARLFKTLESVLDLNERENILRIAAKSDIEYFRLLCQLLFEQELYQDILHLVEKDPDESYALHDKQVAEIYLEAAHKLQLNMTEVSERVIVSCPEKNLLQKIKSLVGSTCKNCEEIVREKNPGDLLMYYEEEGRMKEALFLVLTNSWYSDLVPFSFFKRNKEHFPSETLKFLDNRINEDLKQTGKKYYERIAESLDLMRQIDRDHAGRIADEIRANFKRRTKLLQIIGRL